MVKMKKILCTLFAAAVVAAMSAVTAFAEDNLIFVKTVPAPKEVVEYAEDMFDKKSSLLTDIGLTKNEAKKAKLAAPFVMKEIFPDEDEYTTYYFPIMCGENIAAFCIINSRADGKLGWQMGKQGIEERFNGINSSPADPAEIYIENNSMFGSTFAVTNAEITVLRDTLENASAEQTATIEKLREEDKSADYVINVYGYSKMGWITLDGEKYFIKQNGTLATKNTTIGGKRYKFAADGKCLGTYTGFARSGKNRCHYKDGVKQTGDFTVNGKTYHADKNGIIESISD